MLATEVGGLCTEDRGGLVNGTEDSAALLLAWATAAAAAAAYLIGGRGAAAEGRVVVAGDWTASAGLDGRLLAGLTGVSIFGVSVVVSVGQQIELSLSLTPRWNLAMRDGAGRLRDINCCSYS